jgi:hypothetical protein
MTDNNAELLRAWHDRLGAMIDQVGQPDYSLREMVVGMRDIRDEMYSALATAPQDATSNAEGRHPDDVAVDRFAAAMKEKLAVKRAQGRGGWDDPEQCSLDYLVRLFHDHVSKGDPIDIGNFAMMLWNRMAAANLPIKYKHIPSAPPPQQQDDCVRVDKGLLLCVALTLRGALDCKDWHWSPDQWDAGDAWCTQLMTILAAAKVQK